MGGLGTVTSFGAWMPKMIVWARNHLGEGAGKAIKAIAEDPSRSTANLGVGCDGCGTLLQLVRVTSCKNCCKEFALVELLVA